MTNDCIKTPTLIIGFGLTAIPLVRELEREGREYTIISSGNNVWSHLERVGRLDFDLVSSYLSSIFSFEQVESQITKSEYPTAREFHEFIVKYKEKYGSAVIDDWVTQIIDYESHSEVHTRSGQVYETENLVIATAFRRKIDTAIYNFDFAAAKNKTVVLNHMGDSSNLMVAKLIAGGNRIILLNNGFFCLDKMITHGGVAYGLDDIEMHNIGHASGYLYKVGLPQGQLVAASMPGLCKVFFGSNFFIKHPRASRDLDRTPALNVTRGSPFTPTIPNGIKVIKYWPIDVYKEMFEDSLEESIERGFLLNDITYLLEHGLVELWPHNECTLDRESSVVKWKDQVVQYDEIIEGDQEVPNIPPIVIKRPDQPDNLFQYDYRECFMGMMPRDLTNTYLLGHTRPMTGGLNNISEMQCLFTHKMLTDETFNAEITGNIGERIDAYNAERCVSQVRTGADNLLFYGQYTEGLGRLMGIHPRLSDCRSLEDLSIYYFFPNAACKYRQKGPYAVEGMSELIRKIHKEHNGYSVAKAQISNLALTLLTAIVGLVLLYLSDMIWFPLPLLIVTVLLLIATPVLSLINANSNRIAGLLNVVLVAALGLTAYTRNPLVPLGAVAFNFLLVFICRKLGVTRVWFNDMQHKSRETYGAFFDRYCEAYRTVTARRNANANAEEASEAGSPAE